MVIDYYLSVIMLRWVHEHHIAKSDFPKFTDVYLTFCYLTSPFISDGEIHLDTPYSRLLGKPPTMVAHMTPSTVKAGFVSTVLDAGYHIELAGGGHYNTAALHSRVAEIPKQIPAGIGITLNLLYINPIFNYHCGKKCVRRVF